MNQIIKKILLSIPSVKIRYEYLQQLRESNLILESEKNHLRNIIELGRSPGLSSAPEDLLTERLMAHPVLKPRPNIELASVPASDLPNRVEIAERLISSYHKALVDEADSPMKRDGEDVWTGLLRNELPDLLSSIDKRDPVGLAEFLKNFGKSYVWFGGITTCIDGYNRNLERSQIGISYWDKLVCLAESLGIIRMENPENGPWGENLLIDPSRLTCLIEKELGIDVSAPLGIIHTDGLKTHKGVFHYRHINSLYSAIRATRLTKCHGSVCEIGGGIGLTAMYALRLGQKKYTILDLPITCLLAGHYLMHAVGANNVALYGEKEINNGAIKILPYWEYLNLKSDSFELVLNQDSLPEIADNLVMEFLDQIKRTSNNLFLSINHECFYPRTVKNFVHQSGGFEQVYRTKCWVREGYLEELYRVN